MPSGATFRLWDRTPRAAGPQPRATFGIARAGRRGPSPATSGHAHFRWRAQPVTESWLGERHVLTLYDTGRGRRAVFRAGRRPVTMYVCGITPYDTTHLGHARTFLLFDVLVRHLEGVGHRVRYAQNATDLDEPIPKRAARDGESWRDLGRREERAYLAEMKTLNWRRPDVMPHVTREIPAMRALAERLLKTGHAYRLPDGGLYYDVTTFPRYGALSRLAPARMRAILAGQDAAD